MENRAESHLFSKLCHFVKCELNTWEKLNCSVLLQVVFACIIDGKLQLPSRYNVVSLCPVSVVGRLRDMSVVELRRCFLLSQELMFAANLVSKTRHGAVHVRRSTSVESDGHGGETFFRLKI